MEAFLESLLPRLLPEGITSRVHAFQGRPDLLGKLGNRLRGYTSWLPKDWRIIVVVDRDNDECLGLKGRLERMAKDASLLTRSVLDPHSTYPWRVANRIAVEELEAWYFGDWKAVRQEYPRLSQSVPRRAKYRDPDRISGGTWEALERILQRSGYFETGLRKVEAARAIGARVVPSRNTSQSFVCLRDTLIEATT